MVPPPAAGAEAAGAGRGRGGSTARRGTRASNGAAAAGLLTQAARRVVARAISLLQDDGLLLSSRVRLVLLIFALCWDDHGAASLSILFGAHNDSNSDWLQERIGLLMLLRWAASFLLPAWPPLLGVAAGAVAHTIALSSRQAMAAGCASRASNRQRVQAMMLVQLLQLAYWLPAANAVCTILAAMWSCAWGNSSALLLQEATLRAVALCALCCERWRLHAELLSAAHLEDASAAACQPLLYASRQVASEFGCWPLHAVRTLLHQLSPQAAPHLAASCLRPPTVSRMYALAAALELATQARGEEEQAGVKYLMCPPPSFTVTSKALGEFATMLYAIMTAAAVSVLRTLVLVSIPFADIDGAMEALGGATSFHVLYLADGPPQPDAISRPVSAAAAAVAGPLHRSTLRVCRRALAIVTWLSRRVAGRQALHAYALAVAGASVVASEQGLWQLEPAALLTLAAAVKLVDVASLQVAFGVLPFATFAADWFLGASASASASASAWWIRTALPLLLGALSHRCNSTSGHVPRPARVLFSLVFWLVAARSAYLTAAAALADGSWRRVPAALLLNPAVLPHALVLALSAESWARQAAVDSLALLCYGRPAIEIIAAVETAAPLQSAGWWPLEVSQGLLQPLVALLSGAPGTDVAGCGPYPLPYGLQLLLAVIDSTAGSGFAPRDPAAVEFVRSVVHSMQTEFGSHCQSLVAGPLVLFFVLWWNASFAVWQLTLGVAAAAHRAKRLLLGQAAGAPPMPTDASGWMAAAERAARLRTAQQVHPPRRRRQQGQQQAQQQRPGGQSSERPTASAPSGSAAPTSGPVVFATGSPADVAQRPHNRQQRQLHREQQRRQHQQQQPADAAQPLSQATQAVEASQQPEAAAARASPAPAPPRKRCANCGVTSGGGVKLKKCGGCRRVRYCSAECQAAQWEQHKLVCAPAE